MRRKLTFSIALICTTPIILTGCVNNLSPYVIESDSGKENTPPESIIIEGPESVYLGCGTYAYSVKVEPVGADDDVEWSSSDDSILTVDSLGRAQPQKEGQVTITAVSRYAPDIRDTINVTVADAPIPTAINIAGPDIVYLHKEPSYHYSILTEPTVAKTDAVWSVNDTNIATINQNGNLSPKKAGKVTIYAASAYNPAVTNTFEVEIKPEAPKKITIIGDDAIRPGSVTQYKVEVDSPDVCADVSWSSSDQNLLTIDEEGFASAGFDQGSVKITARSKADSSIVATKNVLIKEDIVYVKFNSTIGTGYDHFGLTYGEPGKSFQVSFRSRVYKDDETWLVIHKELKPTDVEVVVNGANIMKQCTMEHNILTVPIDSSIESGTTIYINILGAEISDWVSWDNIAKICEKDYDDLGRPGKHYAAQYFQVGDYKKGYQNRKLCGEYVIVDEYHDTYEAEDHAEIVNVPLALTFMPKVMHISPDVANAYPKSRWDDGYGSVDELILFHNWRTRPYNYEIEDEETHEVTIMDYLRKNLHEFKLDGLSRESVRAPKKIVATGKHDIPYIESDLFWAPSFDEVYDPRVPNCSFAMPYRVMGYEDGDPTFEYVDMKEGSLYAYFDQDKYHFHNDNQIRVPDPENRKYDDGYVDVQLMLRSAWYIPDNWDPRDGNISDAHSCPKRGFCLFTWLSPDADTLAEKEVRYPNTYDKKPADVEYTYSASFCI